MAGKGRCRCCCWCVWGCARMILILKFAGVVSFDFCIPFLLLFWYYLFSIIRCFRSLTLKPDHLFLYTLAPQGQA